MMIRRSILTAALGILLAMAVGVEAASAAAAAPIIRLKVTAEIANIRQKPSISSLIVRQIPEGALLEASRKDGEWYLVALEPDETGTNSGYVHESLVLPLDEPAVPEKKTRIVERVTQPKPKPAETTPPPARTEPAPVHRTEPAVETPAAKTDNYGFEPLRPALVIGGGGLIAAVGDLNDGSQGLADYFGYQLGAAADLTLSRLRLVFPFEAEIQIPIGGRFALTIGAGYAGASATTLVTYATTGSANSFSAGPGFSAIPIKAGLLYSPVPSFYAKAGLMVVPAKASYTYHFTHDQFWQEWTGEASAFGFGAYGALGIELTLGPSIGFLIEAGGQIGKISGFDGTGTYLDSTLDEAVTETGLLYAYDAKPTQFDSFPLTFIRSKRPTEGGVANAREATLDLLGISLKAGLKFKF
ncbi:MAG: SH3 domain-containing protein [Candidatus Aminicenantes bacterium]|nr:SH3 domain-containing protein [Candidatus Aminicenantes bacterium]